MTVSSILLAAIILSSQVDPNRTAWNPAETIITSANVPTIHPVGFFATDGPIYAQPLIAPVMIRSTMYNALFTCTMNDTCYAFDADSPGVLLWRTPLGIIPRTSYPASSDEYGVPLGCLSTPSIDPVTQRMFAICSSSSSWVLFCIDLVTGAIRKQTTIAGAYGGAMFDPGFHNFRSGVTLANGNVYIMAACLCNEQSDTWHGWAFAYDENLNPVGVFCTTPTGNGGGIWSSGAAASVDSSGNLYVSTGNGSWDGISNFSESVLKLSPTLTLLDWFTPSDWASLMANDEDLASNRAILIPGTSLLVHTAKDFRVFLLSQSDLGHLQGTGTAPVQVFTMGGTVGSGTGAYGSAWMNETYYIPSTIGGLSAFSFNGSTFNPTTSASINFGVGFPGPAGLFGSGTTILWAVTPNGDASTMEQTGMLHALNPSTLAELWNSGSTLGHLPKFAAPVVANGKVYVSTLDNQVQVYGLPPGSGAGRISISSVGIGSVARR